MSRTIKEIVVGLIILIIIGLVVVHKYHHPESKITAIQMVKVEQWSRAIDARLKGVENNLLYLRKQIEDPNSIPILSEIVAPKVKIKEPEGKKGVSK